MATFSLTHKAYSPILLHRKSEFLSLTTFRNRHVEIAGSSLRFEFRGKSGVMHSVAISDRRVARIVRRCQTLPGEELFQYLDEEGRRQTVDSGDINSYLRKITGGEVTAKDYSWDRRLVMSEKSHILVLYSDQMQHDRMGFIDGIAHTPNLNRLAEEGIHFTHMITQQGQCVPSRAVFLTGQSAHECGVMVNYGFTGPGGVHNEMITAKNTTFAHALQAHGYRTVYFGKGHLGSPIEDLGFDEGMVNDQSEISDEEAASRGLAHVPPLLRRDYASTEWAIDYLKKYKVDGKLLCFFFSTNLPHPPFFSEIKYAHLFPPENIKLPQSFYEESFVGKPTFQKEHTEDGRHGAFDEKQMRKETADYYTMIAKMDEQFGEVISEFKRLGLWDDTLVMFISDHGDMMGAHRMHLKGVIPYDELYRAPMIVKLPKGMRSKRSVIDDLLCSQAVAGTILKLAGCDVPEIFTGGDFTHVFENEKHPEHEKVFFEHYLAYWGYHPFYGVRTRSAKYIRYYGPEDTEEMYDLERDPYELKNVASDTAYEKLKAELSKEDDSWWQATGGRDANYYESTEFRNNSHNL